MKPTTIALICLGAVALGVFLGHATKTCKPCEFTQADLDSIAIVNHHLTEQYLADSINSAKKDAAIDSLKKAHNKTPVKDRQANAIKTTHDAHHDSLLWWHTRPIGSALGTPQ